MIRASIILGAWIFLLQSPSPAETRGNFAEVLALADLDPNGWPPIETPDTSVLQPTLSEPTRQLCRQLLYRLNQFPDEQLRTWAMEAVSPISRGQLELFECEVTSVWKLEGAQESSDQDKISPIYLCECKNAASGQPSYLLVPKVPNRWLGRASLQDPVDFVGLALQDAKNDVSDTLRLTNHIAWYPTEDVPRGWLLLSEQGMDVSLLDEVRHRHPFVKPSVSREGDAFYACLLALAKVEPQKLAKLTLTNLSDVADEWENRSANDKKQLQSLRRQLKELPPESDSESLEKQISDVRRKLAIASAVSEQADRQLSSVAPLFLQPEQETGQLVRVEGLARRAVRIAAEKPGVEDYFELEVFTSDSQNLPVVCCTSSLPEGFPEGDEIRESVRLDGVFFKSWRYRTRKNLAAQGQTARQQQLYTPIVIGRGPIWLTVSPPDSSHWALVGGVGVLLAFGVFWMQILRSSQRAGRELYSMDPATLEQQFGSDTTESSRDKQ